MFMMLLNIVRLWLLYLWNRPLGPKMERTARDLWERNAVLRKDFPVWDDWLDFIGEDGCRAYIDAKMTGQDWRDASWLKDQHDRLETAFAKEW